ncbi:MAG: TadA family conjugal transfer-associated ATPase [Candidatus Nanopelagicales bacterium]
MDRVRTRLVANGTPATAPTVAAAIRADGGAVLGDRVVLDIADHVQTWLSRAGPLQPLLDDPGVTDVLVNGPSEVWFDRGEGLQRTGIDLRDETSVRSLAQRLSVAAGRRLDDAAPWVDARLPDGTRLHAVLSPVARSGTCISLRVPPRRPFDLDDLEEAGSVDQAGRRLLEDVIEARLSFLVTGGTGAGKTTLLSCLLGLVPDTERLVLVEDTGELAPAHRHVVRLEARPDNVEGRGGVSLRDLVRQSLRMRPDRLVVGEVRGAEVVELLAALNTGHEGGCGTIHANAPMDVVARVEALALAAGMTRAAVHSQLAAGLDAVIHVQRQARPGGSALRFVSEVGLLDRRPDGLVEVTTAAAVIPGTPLRRGPAYDRLCNVLTGRRT